MNKVFLLGTGVDSLDLEGLLEKISQAISLSERLLIAHANLRGLNLAYELPWLQNFYNRFADIVYCDGMGVKLGALLIGQRILERFTLADWIWNLADLAVRNNYSLFLLGNPPGVTEAAASELYERSPTLRIVGVQHGFFEKSPTHPENVTVVERINQLKPDILLVGFGMPAQEKWLEENWTQLNVPVAITCGALFEYLAGHLRRGPRWMTDHYLEWLARMWISPKRYYGRYLRDIPLFLFRIIRQRFEIE